MTYKPLGVFRTLLALIVIGQHVRVVGPAWMNQGELWIGSAAVLVFFALSGQVITEAAETFYARRPIPFAVNRAIRIVPQFVVALILSAGLHLLLGPGFFPNAFANADFATMFSPVNLVLNAFSILPGFHPHYAFVPYTWAIVIEVIFYSALFLGLFASLKLDAKWIRRGLLAFAVALFLFRHLAGGPVIFDYAAFFVYGAACYWSLRDRSWPAIVTAVISYAACVFVCLVIWADDPGRLIWTGLVAVLLPVIPALSAVRVSDKVRRLDRRIGDLSYPIYLQQYAVILAVYAFAPRAWWSIALVFVLAILAGWLSDRLLERSIVSLRDKVRGRSLSDEELGTTTAP